MPTAALLRERLINGRVDMAVLFADRPERGFAASRFCWRNFSLSLRSRIRRPFDSPMRRDIRCWFAGPGSGSRHVAEEAFRKHGLTVTSIAEIDTLSTLRRAIASGIGNAILSWSALYDSEGKIALNYRRIADAKLVRPVALCFSEVGQRSPAIEAVALTLKSLVYELVESGTWQGVAMVAPQTEPTRAMASCNVSVLDGRPGSSYRRFGKGLVA